MNTQYNNGPKNRNDDDLRTAGDSVTNAKAGSTAHKIMRATGYIGRYDVGGYSLKF
jgi:hypothetical protein